MTNILDFTFYIDDILIGTSKLEKGDPSMGVAYGEFFPTTKFANFDSIASPLEEYSRNGTRNVKRPSVKC